MRRALLSVVILVALAGAAHLFSAAERAIGGPFVVDVTSRTAKIAWLVPGGQFKAESMSLTSLQPNTRYEYNIEQLGEAGKVSFKTPPEGPGPFTFVAYGDNRTRHDVHRRVVARILEHGVPDFILQTGDMVENGNDAAQWPVFFEIEKDLLRQAAFFPALGNHERHTEYFQSILHDGLPYYSFDWGNAHFTVLDSDIDSKRSAYWNEQVRWLEEDLKAHQAADFRFVIAHHPPFTAVFTRQGSNPHMTVLVPLFERYRVSAGFFGHDHNYQHYLQNGIHYVITGGGGAPLYDVSRPPKGITIKLDKIENFVSVSVNGKAAHFTAISIDGKALDDFEIQAPAVRKGSS